MSEIGRTQMQPLDEEGSEYRDSQSSEDDHNDSTLFNMLSLSKQDLTQVST